MLRFFSLLLSVFIFFGSVHVSGSENYTFNPKNYVYDDGGSPQFVKVYVEPPKRNHSADLSLRNEGFQVLNLMMQEDQKGSFLVVPIKKKKTSDDDDDESTWTCPYCDTINEASRNTCKNPECVLYRKPGRDWNNLH